MITNLIVADAGSRIDLTGYAIDKANKRKSLETLALKVSNALAAYSVVVGDIVLQKKSDFPTSNWYKYSEEELVTQATIVKNLAVQQGTNFQDYGANPTDVSNLLDTITMFTNVISNPTLAIDQRKDDNESVVEILDEIRTLLNKIDVVMRSFEVNNPSLYALYQSARALDINGSVMAPTTIVDVAASSTTNLHTATEYNANTFYTIQNMGTEAVTFSLSNTIDAAGDTPILLNAGETRSILAENLAPTGVYFQVTNPNTIPIKIRVWVE